MINSYFYTLLPFALLFKK